MNNNKKEVILTCYRPLSHPRYKNTKTMWLDIWITIHDKKRKITFAPCFIGLNNIDDEITFYTEWLEEDIAFEPDGSKDMFGNVRKKPTEEDLNSHREAISYYTDIKERFDNESVIIDSLRKNMEDVYVNEELLGREELEKDITYYLQTKGFSNSLFKFKWKCPDSKLFVHAA